MPKHTTLPAQPDLPKLEEEILSFWQETKAFEKSVEMRSPDKSYVFYDGPPFATGLPHYGHLLASTIKDVVPRYWTMKGYRVERVWGWDCHGLPIENMIEKQLDIKGGKKGIEELGIDKFNQACRAEVLRLDTEWEKIINRLGRWVDFKNNYKTMDLTYMESVWWGFKQLWEKGLVYEGRKVVMYCPRCATPLSNFEIAMDNSYEMTEDWSIYPKFKVVKNAKGEQVQVNEFLLAWTTTPWTLPGNVALAVKPEARYVQVKVEDELYWLAEALLDKLMADTQYQVVQTVAGQELVGTQYEPLFPYLESGRTETAWTVLPAEFVSLEDGTGIVHTAALYGEDDYQLALHYNLPLVQTLDDQGRFLPSVELVAGLFYKKAEEAINQDLQERGLVFRLERFTHSYPFCYRCATPLYYNAVPAWFINVQQLKPDLVKHNETINWFPQHLKYGRFGKGLETAPDWNISRSRYWGTPMPIWVAADVNLNDATDSSESRHLRVIGSLEELKEWAVEPEKVASLTDIHREFLDDIEVWVDDARTVKGRRLPEVFDCWVESGSMPFASRHYPFENKEQFDANYPAQFVSEYIAQTRAWFYTMHVLSVGIFNQPSFENVLTTGTILAKDGAKMSKSKKNYPDPMLLINQYGVDSLRLYMMSTPVMKSENVNFDDQDVAEIRKKVFLIWYNMYAFYRLYAGDEASVSLDQAPAVEDVMDKWVLSRLHTLIQEVTEHMDGYNVVKASRLLMEFVDELSTWYLRRSRDRLREGTGTSREVFGYVLITLAQLFAPFAPFFAEWLYHQMVDEKGSIHHTDWPTAQEQLLHPDLEQKMAYVRQVVEKVHALRREAGLKIRQPLARLAVTAPGEVPLDNLLEVLKDEVNVKHVEWQQGGGREVTVALDTVLTPELEAEGEARELMRQIQKLRKQANLTVSDQATAEAPSWPTDWQTEIERKTNTRLVKGDELRLVS